MYSTAQAAANAVAALKNWGFTDDMISVVGPGQHAADEAVVSALMAAYVVRGQARHYADAVRQGQTAVVVRAEFGKGEAAQYHMNCAGPVSREDAFREPFVGAWDEAAPFSSIFRLPTKSEFRPFGGLPTVTKRGSTLCSKLGIPELTSSSKPTTEALGMPMLLKSGPALRSLFKG
jgi:hypothetical protein